MNLFTIAAMIRDVDTGHDRQIRLVVHSQRGVYFELLSAKPGTPETGRTDVSDYAQKIHDALQDLLGGRL